MPQFGGNDNNTVVENDLTSTSTTNALSANMGRHLNTIKWQNHGLKENADLDTLKDSGNYYIAKSFAGTAGINYPVQINQDIAWLEVYNEIGNRIIQKLQIPSRWGDIWVFERWWADGTWRPWSQVSNGSIDLTPEFDTNPVDTISQIFKIQNFKFNILRGKDRISLNSIQKTCAEYLIPAPLLNEGGRLYFTFTHHAIADRNKSYHLETSKFNTEFILELYHTNHPDQKYQLFKPCGGSMDNCKNNWYVSSTFNHI